MIDPNSDNDSDNNVEVFSLKRPYEKTVEFMPLSKSNLFEADEDNCEYDWGFKNVSKKSKIEGKNAEIKNKKEDNYYDSITRKDAYRTDDPTKLNEEDKEIFFENLDNIYKKNLVYIPSFYDIDDVVSNINSLIQSAIPNVFETELKRLRELLENLWIPLNENYVMTERLSKECSAYKMIVKGVEQYTKAVSVYESCIIDFSANAANYIEVVNTWKAKDVDVLTTIFKDTVGKVLLKYKETANMPLEVMAQQTNAAVFMRMVTEDVSTVKKRVEKMKKAKKVVVASSDEENDDVDGEDDTPGDKGGEVQNRAITTSMMQNKGIVPKRKKTNKNPRLKHRMKFKKAIIKHHSQVPRERKDAGNYEGEASGIRIGVIKARKFK